jgi:hypothetical protein
VKTYFKVPEAWKLYNDQEIFAATPDSEISPQQLARRRASQWVVAFDGDPSPSISHILDEHARYPMGFAKVRLITDSERDTFSLASLRNEVMPLDDVRKLGNGTVEPLKVQDIVRHDGMHGNRQVQNVKVEGGFFTMDQTALVDPGTRLLYLLLVGCEARCYLDNQTTIDEIVRSWTVKAP